MENSLWSEELQELTKKTLDDLFSGMFTGGKNCHFKKKTGTDREYGYIENDPRLITKAEPILIKIKSKSNEKEWVYKSIDETIKDGWAVD